MTELTHLLSTIKVQLKLQGKTYKEVALALGISEASVKRILRDGSETPMTLDRLLQISHLLGFSLMELTQEAEMANSKISTLSHAQEAQLVSDIELLLVTVCALNHWTIHDILAVYNISESRCIQKLLKLDTLRLITLLPNNRIRLNVTRDFDWLSNGPIRQYFMEYGMSDFLDDTFQKTDSSFHFCHGMLTDAASEKLEAEIQLFRRRFAELHQESLASPLKKRRGRALLLASREWEHHPFTKMRR
jgi:transcriptional regulator with XRE-family HTH domain